MQSRKAYCSRCQKSLPLSAKQQHIEDSPNHNIYHVCSSPPDYTTEEDLDEHLEDEHNICASCDRQFDTPSQLAQHNIAKHNMCMTCRQYFSAPANLNSHMITHAEKNIGCPGCSRLFPTNSAMMLHLEAGTCVSGVDLDEINRLAFECYQAQNYESDNPDFDFKCPPCQTPFLFMSGLLQHVESDYCKEELGRGSPLNIFLHFIRSCII